MILLCRGSWDRFKITELYIDLVNAAIEAIGENDRLVRNSCRRRRREFTDQRLSIEFRLLLVELLLLLLLIGHVRLYIHERLWCLTDANDILNLTRCFDGIKIRFRFVLIVGIRGAVRHP